MLHEGDVITIDGTTGNVYPGRIPTVEAAVLRRAGDAAALGRRSRPARGHGQRRHAARRRPGPRVRRDGHRAVPHRAHVQRSAASADRAGDDPGRHAASERQRRARPAAADPARGLQGHLRRDGRAAGDRAAARPADARVPADRLAARIRDRPPAQPAAGDALGGRAAGNAAAARPRTAARICRRPRQAAGEPQASTATRPAAMPRSRGARRCCARCTR